MNIAYACNRYYLRHTMVSLYSLLTNGRGDRPARILLAVSSDLKHSDLDPIFRMVSRFPGCTASAVWPQRGTDRRFAADESCIFSGEAAQSACYRLFFPDLFQGQTRCLYLDSDTVIRHPLTELYDMNMGSASMAGVTDRLCLEEDQVTRLKTDWGIEPGYYINTGVILMNLDRMRSSGGAERALELAYRQSFRYADQDVLNQIYRNEVVLLPKEYNVFPEDCLRDMEALRMLLPEHAGLFSDNALGDPAIVHYIGENKPWNCGDVALARYWHEAESACGKQHILQ